MARNYSMPTIKALFAQAMHCAYPGCTEPLVFEDPARGVRSIAVQIAHIRSEKSNGPRYDASYAKDKINSEENLLLLCGKHHTPVDQNESVFTAEELLEWKAVQLVQGVGTVVTDNDLANLMETLESTLSALYDALRVAVSLDLVAGRPEGTAIIVMPLEGIREITMPTSSKTVLIGVKVVNKGSAAVDIAGAGVHVDFGASDGKFGSWIFGGPWCQHSFPYRHDGRSTEYWYVDEATIRLTFAELGKQYGIMPRRFRPFAHIGDDTTETGAWREVADLPFWSDEEHGLFAKIGTTDRSQTDS
jgi:hypothetical protein